GSGRRKFPQDQLEAARSASDPMADLMAGRFADPDLLRRLILHERLNGRQRDVLYSMDVTDTEFHAYQFKPVVKLLSSPSQGLLIADEVGLGKTIEAGLIWTELVARFDAHRLLVVCPKSLTEKWRQELWQKFSVDAKIRRCNRTDGGIASRCRGGGWPRHWQIIGKAQLRWPVPESTCTVRISECRFGTGSYRRAIGCTWMSTTFAAQDTSADPT